MWQPMGVKDFTGNSGVRRRPKLQLWIGYLLTFLSLPSISAICGSNILTNRCTIGLTFDPPTKSSITLHWQPNLAFPNVNITGYTLSYCPIDYISNVCDTSVEKKYVSISNPKQMAVTIAGLYSFRTYQFTIALNTKHGLKAIEDGNVFVTTLEDVPSSPKNVQISNVTKDSLVISWNTPQIRNGIIHKYVIWNYDKVIYEVKGFIKENSSNHHVALIGLPSFTNYSLTVQACNHLGDFLCSERGWNDSISVRTNIGPPSRLKAPAVISPDMLMWEAPENAGGMVDLYQIRRIKDNLKPEIISTKEKSYSLIYCEGVVSTETYEVRAVNFDTNVTLPNRPLNGSSVQYPGSWSETTTMMCYRKDYVTMVLIFIGIFVLIAAMAYGSVKLYKKYKPINTLSKLAIL